MVEKRSSIIVENDKVAADYLKLECDHLMN
jgi:hypothetical protein